MKKISELVIDELERESEVINLIASEAPLRPFLRNILGTSLHQKYAEGYPGKRYYNGCGIIDEIEEAAIDAVARCFGTKYANVQPHSGSTANQAVWKAAEKIFLDKGFDPSKRIPTLSMKLDCGGHLSHFSNASFNKSVCETYDRSFYGVKENGEFDWDAIKNWVALNEWGIIVIGCSSYPLSVDYKTFSKVINSVKDGKERNYVICFDVSHIAGLLCTRHMPHPFYYDWGDNASLFMTSTTHKTWGGPRHAVICWDNPDLSKYINHAVFPELQGGANFAIIAAVGAWAQWIENNYLEYCRIQTNIVKNTAELAEPLKEKIVFKTGINHIALVRCKNKKQAQTVADELEKSKIIVNVNSLYDGTWGLRLSASYETQKGIKHPWKQIGEYINYLIDNLES